MSSRKQISNTFTVTTVDDPVSVQAQYAPNSNPSAGQIHTVWQSGDLYMRTRESDSSVWSSWHKIVGESGDETDFSFGISSQKTTANAQTAPSDISSWSDAPVAVTSAKPYLWAKVQKKAWNETKQDYDVTSTSYIRLTGDKGDKGDTGSAGATGPQGKIGRFYYYAQAWSNDSTISYQVTDTEAPYFSYNNQYWIFNPTANGTYTMSSMGTPSSSNASSSNANWKLMVTDFKYLITEAIFGAYAHFGSALINGDWLISANGIMNGTSYTGSSNIGNVYLMSSTNTSGKTTTVKPYTHFDPSNPHGNSSVMASGTSLVTLATTETSHNLMSAYLTAGHLYYVSVTGYCANASYPHYVRVYSSSYGTVTPSIFSSTTSATRGFYLKVSVSGTYYIQLYRQTSGYAGYATAYSITRYCFAPNYAVDLLAGVSYQKKVYASGGMRSPFSYLSRGGTFTEEFSDNIGVYSSNESYYYIPNTVSQSGRKVVITNHYWDGNYSKSRGFAQVYMSNRGDNQYFYEDGVRKTSIKLSREGVELLGYGDSKTFYGWIVLKRFDLGTESRYGRGLKILAMGRVSATSSSKSVACHTFDGTTMSVVRNAAGDYTLSFSDKWYEGSDKVLAFVTPFGYSKNGDSATSNICNATHIDTPSKSSIRVITSDKDNNGRDGSFNFLLINFDDWVYAENAVND